MSKLKSLKVVAGETGSSKKGDIPEFQVSGNEVYRFLKLDEKIKTYTAKATDIKDRIKADAFDKFAKHNLGTPVPVSSVRIIDETESSCLFSSQDKYSSADESVVSDFFTSQKLDVNDFVSELPKVSFDSEVFFQKTEKSPLGEFNEKAFNEVQAAVEEICKKHQIKNPLASKIVVTPKPGFHTKRWAVLPSLQAQKALFEVLPNTQTLKKG